MFDIQSNFWSLKIILPVGISFYTFHGLSYVIDIYNKRIKAEKNVVDYSLFVSFFPLLVAGPIERATHLLPQIKEKRVFNYSKALDGMRQILWGLFKKVVIADNCASYANEIFAHPDTSNGSTLALGAVFFAFQIYGDFSGYSDIALGTARLFGYELLQNFKFPYFSRNIAEFWKRWHISLSSWFRDYLYIPLGGNANGKTNTIRNTFIIFLVSGFWHGASWNFIIWGFLHALFFLPLLLMNQTKIKGIAAENSILPSIKEFLQITLTFTLVCIAWVFFRAETLSKSLTYLNNLFSSNILSKPQTSIAPLFLITFLIGIEWIQRKKSHALQIDMIKQKGMRWGIYLTLCFVILFGTKSEVFTFIYFQF
ncbi:MAG: MBOAT family O-acyltransferase [Flavobacteriales bacterium]